MWASAALFLQPFSQRGRQGWRRRLAFASPCRSVSTSSRCYSVLLTRPIAEIDTLGLSSPFRSAYPYPLPSSITSLVLHATETAAFRQDLATQLIGNARAGHLARLVDLAVSDEAGLLSLLPLAPQLRSLRLPEPIVAPSVVDPPINTWSLYSAFLPACSGLTSLNIDRLSTSLSFQFLPPNIVRLRVASFSPARRGGRSEKRARCRSVSSLFSPSTSTRRRSTVCPSCWTVAFASSRCLHRFCAIMLSFQCYSAGENTAGFPFLPSPSKLTTVYKERSERRRSGRIRSHYRATLRSSPTAKSTLGISPLPPSLLLHLTPHFLSPMASAPESDSTTDPFDLLTVDDYTDKLVEAVERDEVEQVLFWSKQLKQNRAGGERSKINQPRTSSALPCVKTEASSSGAIGGRKSVSKWEDGASERASHSSVGSLTACITPCRLVQISNRPHCGLFEGSDEVSQARRSDPPAFGRDSAECRGP